MGEGVAVEAGSAGIAADDSKAAVDSETAAGSKSSQTHWGERSTSKLHHLVYCSSLAAAFVAFSVDNSKALILCSVAVVAFAADICIDSLLQFDVLGLDFTDGG